MLWYKLSFLSLSAVHRKITITAINLITKWPVIIIKWILTSIMALVLVIGLFILINFEWISKPLPINITDLQKVGVTVKSAIIAGGIQFITPVEYPTQFEISGQIPSDVVARHPINTGDHVDVYLTKNGVQTLQNKSSTPTYVQAYGIVMQNGKQLVDPNQFLDGKIQKHIRDVFTKVFSFPLIYFVCLLAFTTHRKKRSNLNKHGI